jgi:glycerol-3-phosphate acyltransferase PlsY
MSRIWALIIGYAFGLIQTSYFYGKKEGIDIRTKGSGNAGTTNALRTMGLKAGVVVMAVDILKCIAAVIVTHFVLGRSHPEIEFLLRTYAGLGCILGHNYPFYLGFRGGKGVACTAGYINTISLIMTIVGNILFFSTVAFTHYVSLASISVGVMLMIGTVIMGQTGKTALAGPAVTELYIVTAVIVGQMLFRHRSNIMRLIKGTERKTYIFHKNRES